MNSWQITVLIVRNARYFIYPQRVISFIHSGVFISLSTAALFLPYKFLSIEILKDFPYFLPVQNTHDRLVYLNG